MLATAIVVFREVLEIALVLGVVLAATKDLPGKNRWVWIGLGGGILGAGLVALFADAISNMAEGIGQELFNAVVLLTAAIVISWTAMWMRKHARQMTQHLKELSHNVLEGRSPLYSLAIVVALAVLREGSEIVLFTYGMIAAGQPLSTIVAGSLTGLAGGCIVGAMLYYGLIKISPRYIFQVTTWLLVLLAAGMASIAAKFLVSAGFFSDLASPVWDTSGFLSEASVMGKICHALLGYSARPLMIQLIFYGTTLLGLTGTMVIMDRLSSSSAMKKSLAALALLGCGIILQPDPAYAGFKVYSPYVHKGEAELEWRGNYDNDDDDKAKDGEQQQKLAVGYGVTDRWFTEVYGEIEREAQASEDRDWDATAIEWENRFQLTDPGAYFVDIGVLASYEVSLEGDTPDAAEVGLLLAKDTGKFTHLANILFEKEVGSDSEGGVEYGINWSSRYRYNEYFEPGIEIYSNFGKLDKNESFNEQDHRIGPAAYGKLCDNVYYDVGYLIGASDAAPDGTFKWVLEYERHF